MEDNSNTNASGNLVFGLVVLIVFLGLCTALSSAGAMIDKIAPCTTYGC